MARDNGENNRSRGEANRSEYRDNDDQRAPLEGNERSGTNPDSKAEALGDARDNIGNTSRGTDAAPFGPVGNDRTRNRPRSDEFDDDLKRD
jgi:hypothetical protein